MAGNKASFAENPSNRTVRIVGYRWGFFVCFGGGVLGFFWLLLFFLVLFLVFFLTVADLLHYTYLTLNTAEKDNAKATLSACFLEPLRLSQADRNLPNMCTLNSGVSALIQYRFCVKSFQWQTWTDGMSDLSHSSALFILNVC